MTPDRLCLDEDVRVSPNKFVQYDLTCYSFSKETSCISLIFNFMVTIREDSGTTKEITG